MTVGNDEFASGETHGILSRPGVQVRCSSDGLGWTSLYASAQREPPFQGVFSARPDTLIVLHLNGPAGVTRKLGDTEARRMMAPGALFILPGGIDVGIQLEHALESLHIYVRKAVLDRVAAEMGAADTEFLPRLGVRDPLIEQLALCVREQMERREAQSARHMDYIAQLLAARLVRKHSAQTELPSAPTSRRVEDSIRRVIEHMEGNLAEPLSVQRLERISGLGSRRFSSEFKRVTGMSPHRYLMTLRVERAKRMLQQREPIAEIAVACGFSHQEHLTNVFRRFTSVTPGAYRREAAA
ncbi:MAG: helix-turn-helix domain-containing protein [Caulobacteraceae bacterium]